MALSVVFMGTPDFALAALKTLHDNTNHRIIGAYSQPPRPKGRGYQVQPSPVHAYAEERGIEVFTPKSLKSREEQVRFAALEPDIAVVAAYGLLLPPAILETPKYGCLNIHASMLPRWRGASPIQQAIWHGDKESGITIMQMDEGLDTGDMVLRRAMPITRDTNAVSLHYDLATLGAVMICEALDKIAETEKRLPAEPQNHDLATYAPMLSKDDGRVDWDQDAAAIDRQIRALNPWPGVWCMNGKQRLKIHTCTLISDTTSIAAGTLLDRDGHVACANGSILKLGRIQPEGSKVMDAHAAFNGGYLEVEGKLS